MAYVPPPSAIMNILKGYLRDPDIDKELGTTPIMLAVSDPETREFVKKVSLDLLEMLSEASKKVVKAGVSLFPESYDWNDTDLMRILVDDKGVKVSMALYGESFWRPSLYTPKYDGIGDIVALITKGYQSSNPQRSPWGYWDDMGVEATPPHHPNGGWGFVGRPFVKQTVSAFENKYAGYGAKVVKLPNGWF